MGSYILIGTLMVIFGFSIHDIIHRFQKDAKKIKMYDRYKTLIDLLQKNNKGVTIKTHSSGITVKIVLTHVGGTTFFFLAHAFGVLAIEWQENNSKYKKNRMEWYYSEKTNQRSIYNHIAKDIIEYHALNSKKDLTQNQSYNRQNIKINKARYLLSNTTSIEVGDLFNLAWTYTKQLDQFRPLSIKGKFEVLTYNCISILQNSVIKEKEILEHDLITLLIFHLTKNDLIDSIHDLSKFMNYRIQIYSLHFNGLHETPIQSSGILFRLFYVFPLKNKISLSSYPNIPKDFIIHVSNMSSQLITVSNQYINTRKNI